MFYGGSISPPREPLKKKFVIPRREPSASSMPGVRESSLMWPMLDRSNYTEWAMLMQCNLKAMMIWHIIDPGTNVMRSQDR